MQRGLFDRALLADELREPLSEGAILLRGYAAEEQIALIEGVQQVTAAAPFRHMVTPGGQQMSVAMTNCGRAGWVSDRRGYRYDVIDPVSGHPWPHMPAPFLRVAVNAAAEAGFPEFLPDVCLINRYEPGTRLSLHQDKDERDFEAPIVSVSLGLPATFLFGGLSRSERPRRIRLESGDIVAWGGPARLTYHGIAPLADGNHPLTGRCRINLTFRKAL
ncbi:MAG TPA: DNA oxidative demethylase AlkB [Bryobacteraceae bacterium]|jgi:alkylated DNA repair protein (DNA oxidative demethylase)|nr:DNA oxidative demethylase AlkB [Bryobacteraceae bacterium]